MEQGWGTNLKGLYDGTAVRNLDGDQAIATLVEGVGFKEPIFNVAYHPQCPHCHSMVEDFIQLAKLVKAEHVPIKITATNMSKTDGKALDVDGFPTIKYFKHPGKGKEFDGDHRNLAGFVDFLKRNGVNIG